MHRVELKAKKAIQDTGLYRTVPNAPCGVESPSSAGKDTLKDTVPNAPCGVESKAGL